MDPFMLSSPIGSLSPGTQMEIDRLVINWGYESAIYNGNEYYVPEESTTDIVAFYYYYGLTP